VYHARDDLKSVTSALKKALAISDVVIASGGISVGDHDHVRASLDRLRIKEIFWRVSVKPGMPAYFGKLQPSNPLSAKYVFALPGNTLPFSAVRVSDAERSARPLGV